VGFKSLRLRFQFNVLTTTLVDPRIELLRGGVEELLEWFGWKEGFEIGGIEIWRFFGRMMELEFVGFFGWIDGMKILAGIDTSYESDERRRRSAADVINFENS
jgi:hypothetical protein